MGESIDADTEKLHERDVPAMVRLLGEVGGLDADMATKRRALMDGLARLVRADGWLWTSTQVDRSGKTPVSSGVIHGGLSPEQITAWIESSQATRPPLPEHEPLVELCAVGRHFTRTRQELVSDAEWYANPTVRRYRLDVGLDHFLYTIVPFASGLLSAIGMYRHAGAEPFTPYEKKLAHIVTSEVDWLHRAVGPSDAAHNSVAGLSPRLRSVLILMLDGRPRKEVAQLLRISPNTARDHMVKIYKHFGVSSHVDLVRRFAQGDGGHRLG